MKMYKIIPIFFIACIAVSSYAADAFKQIQKTDLEKSSSSGDTVLDTYIQKALKNNAGLRADFDAWQAGLESIPQARGIDDPTIRFTHFVEEVQTRTGPQNNKLEISQKIPRAKVREHAGMMAQSQADQLWWKANETKHQIIYQVKQFYADYAYLAQHIRIVKENLGLLQNLEPVVQARLRSGGNQADLLKLQVEIAKLENELNSLERLRPALNRQLRTVMNDSETKLLPWPKGIEITPKALQLGDLLQTMKANSPVLKQRTALINKSSHHTTHSRLLKKPDVTVGLTYIETGSAETFPKPTGSSTDPFGLTVGISIPLFNKKHDAKVREARYVESSMRHRLKEQQLTLSAELEVEVYHLQDAGQNIQLYKETLIPRAQQAMDVMQVSYQTGTSSLLEIIESERDVLLFEQSYWRAQRDYVQHLAKIEMICGGVVQ